MVCLLLYPFSPQGEKFLVSFIGRAITYERLDS